MILGHNSVRIELRYGAGLLPLEIPQRLETELVMPRTIIKHPNILDEISRSIEAPVMCEPFSQLINNAESIAIVVNSERDVSFNKTMLEILLDILSTSTIEPGNITILFSPYSGVIVNPDIVDQLLGGPILQGYNLVLHDKKNNESLSFIGDTLSYATPVFVNRSFVEADLKIGIGTIRCDIFIGATGGRMSVIPHVSGQKTNIRNSKLQAVHPVGPFMTNSAVCQDMKEISEIAGLDFILNAVLDVADSVAGITSGEPHDAWSRALDTSKTVTEAPILHKADIAIVSAGGAQSDTTLHAAVDSLYSAHVATEFGGIILLIAECEEGAGPQGFVRGVSECSSTSESIIMAESSYEIGMEKACFFWKVLESRKLIICSRMRESLVAERFHSLAVKDPQDGLELARSQISSNPRIAVIPQGDRTLPTFKKH